MTGKAVAFGSPIRRAPDWYESRWRFDTDDAATGWLAASGTEVSYTRRNGGGVAAVSSVAGTTAYSHDAANRLAGIVAPAATFGFGYCDWNGRLSSITNANGFVVEYLYDIMDRVTNIAWKTTSGTILGGFAYEYDAVGRIVSRSHSLGDSSQSSQMSQSYQKNYAHDDLDRLASDGAVSYTYDAAGNRMTKTENGETTIYMLGIGDRLASWTGGAYSYNAAGCVTRIERAGKPTLDLTWDSQYQLVSVSTNGVFAEGYAYDALGRRVSTTTMDGTTRHVYDSNWQVIADIDEQGNAIVSYTWGAGIDNLLAVKIGGATYYPLTDIQGTVWGYIDSQNNIVARWQYDAWGNVVDEDVAIPVLASLRYRFQGRECSAATGLINFRMRWYDAETGRWLSKDPIGLSGGLNLYAFCGNNPICNVDCFGLQKADSIVDRIKRNYNNLDYKYSSQLGLGVTDTLGVVGVASALTSAATSALASIADAEASAVINGAELAGVKAGGSMDHRIAALEKAEQVAARTNVLRTGLRAASKASGVTTAVSTVWSLAVRFGFLINAVVTAVVDDDDDSCL